METIKSHVDIVRLFISALETNTLEQAGDYLGSDFTFSGWTPLSLTKSQFLGVMSGLKSGIPDLAFNLRSVNEENDELVHGTVQMTGNQQDSFILPDLGTPPIPQMAGEISLPPEHTIFAFQNDQITRMVIESNNQGGLQGIFHQIGIDLPIVQ